MARKITNRQTQRIAKHQAARVEQQAQDDNLDTQSLQQEKGLVVTHYGDRAEIQSESGKIYLCQLRQHLGHLVTGDQVIWAPITNDPTQNQGIVLALIPRRSELVRLGEHGKKKPVAANIDQIFVVAAIEPSHSLDQVDSYLIAGELLKIPTRLILNKIDLALQDLKRIEHWTSLYRGLGYSIFEISTKTGEGLPELTNVLKDCVSIFVGQSGVGKSSLIQALLPHETTIRIAAEGGQHGKHTTSSARLYHLSCSGYLIDSPGVRDFHLGVLDRDTLFRSFIEFEPYRGQCKFRNCSHEHEPGCALIAAVEAGNIDPHRLAAFLELVGK